MNKLVLLGLHKGHDRGRMAYPSRFTEESGAFALDRIKETVEHIVSGESGVDHKPPVQSVIQDDRHHGRYHDYCFIIHKFFSFVFCSTETRVRYASCITFSD
ncbi:MAG: hypothetical protein ACI8Z5_002683 [Lentimonas sp.]|jgi:hypothetical protein